MMLVGLFRQHLDGGVFGLAALIWKQVGLRQFFLAMMMLTRF
jgi:hypothetical protein